MPANKIRPKSDTTDIATFIRKTFHRRECIRFLEADSVLQCSCEKPKDHNNTAIHALTSGDATESPNEEAICQCGYSKTVHSNEAVGPAMFYNMSKSWNVEGDTDTFPTNAHGKIEFDETEEYKPFNKPTIKRFIRLDNKVNPDKVVKLLRDYWKMDQPQLFLSVISSETRRNKDAKEKEIKMFCEKLVQAATQTNAWIITEGVVEGIGGVIGDQIEKNLDDKGKRPKAVLSICNWGCIRDKHRLIKENKHNNYIATHSICSKCGGKNPPKEVSLDRNHTNFVLVDDDRQFHPGCERIVRQKLELKLREYETEKKDEYSSSKASIPFIYFLIGGDSNDIQTVERALANQIPVIVAKGTGGAADLIAEVATKEDHLVTRAKIPKGLDLKDSTNLDRIWCSLILIEKSKGKLLKIFDTSEMKDGNEDLSLRILNVLKVNENNPTHIFVLAADWDNKLFFKELLREKPKGSDLDDVMCKLLLKNSYSYVEILLDSGVNLVEVVKQIQDLELTDVMENEIVAHLMHQITSGHQNLSQAEVENKIGKLLCIWSAYNGMTEMAKVFWREGKDYLAMALMAYKVSKDQKRKLAGKEKCRAMQEQMKTFQELATGFLLKCDTANDTASDTASRHNTIALLRGRVPDLKHQTPMQIAFDGDFKEFVAQQSFQELLNQIWTKRIIDYEKYKYIPLTVAIICPFAAPSLFEYREDEKLRDNLDEHSPTMQSFLYFFRKVRSFLKAPVIKFIYNTLTYLAYLVLFSIVMLTDFRTTMSPSEIALTIWTFILIIEECRQVAIFRREYLNKWNLLDVLALTLYVIGFILRIIHQSLPSICPECLYVARIVLSFSLLISILRVLQLLSINPTLGPKIYMIGRLLKDMISFMLIMAIFISAYGIVSNVILYPNQPLNAKLLQDVFYDAWWSVIQQFNREDALGLNCNMDDPSPNISKEYCSSPADLDVDYELCKKQRCPANIWLVSVLLAFYALFTVIMMLNVLVAMFNVTFTTVEGKQERVSKMQRYRLIREYRFRSMIPAPLCVFSYLKYIPWICKLCKYCCFTEDDDYKKMYFPPLEPSKNVFSQPLVPAIKIWEQIMREKYEEDIRVRKQCEFAAMEPRNLGPGRGSVYNLVLNSPNYVNTLMQSFMTQLEQRMLVYMGNPDRRDDSSAAKEEENETDRPKVPPHQPHRKRDDLNNPNRQFGRKHKPTFMRSAQRGRRSMPRYTSPPESPVLLNDQRQSRRPTYQGDEANIQQDAPTKERRPTKKRRPKSVEDLTGGHDHSEPMRSNPDGKLIIRCRDGSVIKLEIPLGKDGEPLDLSKLDWSKLPAKKSEIARIYYE